MNLTSQDTENQDKINVMVAEQISKACAVETSEFLFIAFFDVTHLKQTLTKCAICLTLIWAHCMSQVAFVLFILFSL